MKYKFLLVAGLGLLLSGCASTPTVHTDSAPSIDFGNYRSYTWLQTPQDGAPLLQQRVVAGVDARLQEKGWRRVESPDAADIGLAAHVSTAQKQTIDTFYDAPMWGGWGWRAPVWGAGTATTTVRNYEVGTLVVDMFDLKTRQAVWRGTANGTIPSSPEKLNEGVQAGIDKMFVDFPPNASAD